MTDQEPKALLPRTCPKCGSNTGNDWEQCGDYCPMPQSPHYVAEPSAKPSAPPSADAVRGEPMSLEALEAARAAWRIGHLKPDTFAGFLTDLHDRGFTIRTAQPSAPPSEDAEDYAGNRRQDYAIPPSEDAVRAAALEEAAKNNPFCHGNTALVKLGAAAREGWPADRARVRDLEAENKRLREALENIAGEAERENGAWVHLRRVIGINARAALAAGERT